MKKLIIMAILSTYACHTYQPGDCITASDGYVWKINQIKGSKYIAAGYLENGWGNDTELDFEVLDKQNYYKSLCPAVRIE